MKYILVLNGEPPDSDRLRTLAERLPVYAADGGATICLECGVKPEWVVGDFDSADTDAFPADWDVRSAPDQNRTDFQKLLDSLPEDADDFLVLGGLGGRMDHFLTNLYIAAALPSHQRICFEDRRQVLWRVTPECPWTGEPEAGEDVSLIPVPEAVGVETEGLYWELGGRELRIGGQLGQSNRVTGPVRIQLQAGVIFFWCKKEN